MRISDFEIYKDLLQKKSGLVITPDKSYLLDSRLTPIAKKWGYPTLDSMTLALRGVPDQNLVKDVVEAMTTNETSFFRDKNPFDLFTDTVLPYFLAKRKRERRIRIWCAACSSGQEPYSLAMLLKEKQHMIAGWNIEILATDISHDILDIAKRASYSQFEVQRGLPIQLLVKYFDQNNDSWVLKDEIKNMVTFKYFNLLDSVAGLGSFDIIFCRNVLIYFSEDSKRSVLEKISRTIRDDGFLFLGGAETVLGVSETFKPMAGKRGLYINKSGPHDEQAAKKSSVITQ